MSSPYMPPVEVSEVPAPAGAVRSVSGPRLEYPAMTLLRSLAATPMVLVQLAGKRAPLVKLRLPADTTIDTPAAAARLMASRTSGSESHSGGWLAMVPFLLMLMLMTSARRLPLLV